MSSSTVSDKNCLSSSPLTIPEQGIVNRWGMVQITSGIFFSVSVIALNVIYVCFHSHLNVSYLSTIKGIALFMTPPMAVAINGMIFVVARSLKKRPDFIIEPLRIHASPPKCNEIVPTLPQIEKQERRESEPLPPPPDHLDVHQEEIKEIHVSTPSTIEKEKTQKYTDQDLVQKLIKPAYNKVGLLLKSLLIANYMANNPSKLNRTEIANGVKSDLKNLNTILVNLWNLFEGHFKNMKFAKGEIEKYKNESKQLSIEQLKQDFLNPICAEIERNNWSLAGFKKLLKFLNKDFDCSENNDGINELVKALLEVIPKAIKNEEKKRFFTLLTTTITSLSKREIRENLKETLKPMLSDLKKLRDSLKDPKAIENNGDLLNKFSAQLQVKFNDLHSKLKKKDELKIERQALENEITTLREKLLDSIWQNNSEELRNLSTELTSYEVLQNKLLVRFPDFEMPISELINALKEQEKNPTISTDTSVMQSNLRNAIGKELLRAYSKLSRCDHSQNMREMAHLMKYRPELQSDFDNLCHKFQVKEENENAVHHLKCKIILPIIEDLSRSIDALELSMFSNVSKAELNPFFAKFLEECIKSTITFVEEDTLTAELNKAAHGLNAENPFEDWGELFDLEDYLFSIQLFQPMLSFFFDRKISDLECLTKLYLEEKRTKKILSQERNEQQDDLILSFTKMIEDQQSSADKESIKRKVSIRSLILKQLSLLEDKISQKENREIKVVEKNASDEIPPDLLPFDENLENTFAVDLEALRQNYKKLGIERKLFIQPIKGNFEIDRFIIAAQVQLSLDLKMGVKLIEMPVKPLKDIDFTALFEQESREYLAPNEKEKAVKDFIENCQKANLKLRKLQGIKSIEDKLNASRGPNPFGELMFFAIPIPLDLKQLGDNPLIFLKTYQGGKIAGTLWTLLKIVNGTGGIKPIIKLAKWAIKLFTGKEAEIPVITGLPGLNFQQNEILLNSVLGLIYLFDILIYDLLLSGKEPAKDVAKRLLNGSLLTVLTQQVPDLLTLKNPTPEVLLEKSLNSIEVILNELDPHKIRNIQFMANVA